MPKLDPNTKHFWQQIDSANQIVIIQADNPDGDSLSSSLALEEILSEMGKDVYMFCSMDMPEHLRWLEGWDRVQNYFPSSFDLCIMVDNSSQSLLENLKDQSVSLASKPMIIIDHHATEQDNPQAISICNPQAASTGEVIFDIFKQLGFKLNKRSANLVAASILSDTLGLATDKVTDNPELFKKLAELIELGADLYKLNQDRLDQLKYDPDIIGLRGRLLAKVDFSHNNQIASLVIDHQTIKDYSLRYNPVIVLDEMRFVKNVRLTIGYKLYNHANGGLRRVTVRLRAYGKQPVAQQVAEHFGGGGHPYASGIKFESDDLDLAEIQTKVSNKAAELLEENQEVLN